MITADTFTDIFISLPGDPAIWTPMIVIMGIHLLVWVYKWLVSLLPTSVTGGS